jgi:2',3'-cyclic-nucleotide 2'-phosphodiesterase (5'-nucleotidase family)
LLLDAGNNFSGKGKGAKLKSEYLAKMLSVLSYDALNLGDSDFSLGAGFLAQMRDKYRLSFVSTNIYYRDTNRPFAHRYLIRRIGGKDFLGFRYGGVKVGIFGLSKVFSHQATGWREREIIVKDPMQEAKRVVAKLRERCDLVVALAQMDMAGLRELAQKVEGIDLIIGGGRGRQGEPLKVNHTFIVQPGSRGQYAGLLDLYLTPQGEVGKSRGSLVFLDRVFPDDKEMAKLLKEYNEKVAKEAKRELGKSKVPTRPKGKTPTKRRGGVIKGE